MVGSTILVEIHLGLTADEERQLFHDLNRLTKTVSSNLALKFDNSNPINLFIKETLIDGELLSVSEKDIKDWSLDKGSLPRKDIVSVNARIFLNKTSINGATPASVKPKLKIACQFWKEIIKIDGFGKPLARQNTVAALLPTLSSSLAGV